MNTARTMTRRSALFLVCMGILLTGSILMAGCATSGDKAMPMKKMAVTECPACGGPLTTMPAKDVKTAKCVCPMCKSVYKSSSTAVSNLESYVDDAPATVRVCKKCNTMVGACPACRNKKM